jgi:hypothetical protein
MHLPAQSVCGDCATGCAGVIENTGRGSDQADHRFDSLATAVAAWPELLKAISGRASWRWSRRQRSENEVAPSLPNSRTGRIRPDRERWR